MDTAEKQPQKDNSNSDVKEASSLSFGQKLVGINFNPAGDEKVNRAKTICAELADLVASHVQNPQKETTALEQQLYDHTIGEILNAQMNVVKLLTLKY